jgi:ADP-ribose pyrophosphatase YjhB (NUDIX family)
MKKFEWNSFDRGIFLVNVLAIIHDPKKNLILIGRRENDPHVPQLSWCFPGGRPAYNEDLEHYLKHEVKIKTGFDVVPRAVIFARTNPENRQLLSIYYHCDIVGGKEKAGEKHVENKWVSPTAVKKYFTTSLDPKIYDFLKKLEAGQ